MKNAFGLAIGFIFLLCVAGGVYFMKFRQQPEVATPSQTPAPKAAEDPSKPAFETARALAVEGKMVEARLALEEWMRQFPQSPQMGEARRVLGGINADIALSAVPAPEKVEYTVAPGDAITKIATKHQTTAEWILRANQLDSTMIRVGQKLLIVPSNFKVVVDLKFKTVTLENQGRFFKDYPIIKSSAVLPDEKTETKITQKMAWKDEKQVSVGQPVYIGSSRRILFALKDFGIYCDAPGDATAPPLTKGIELSQPDGEEIFTLVNSGTPVTILN